MRQTYRKYSKMKPGICGSQPEKEKDGELKPGIQKPGG
jgi:hypothetical protein